MFTRSEHWGRQGCVTHGTECVILVLSAYRPFRRSDHGSTCRHVSTLDRGVMGQPLATPTE